MSYAYALWSGLLLAIWLLVFVGLKSRDSRRETLITSALTALLGVTEPLFVPEYWNPPTLFDLAERTGFDLESPVFAFAVGGAALFGAFYFLFFLSLIWVHPAYVDEVWNLADISGVLLLGVPLEEVLFALGVLFLYPGQAQGGTEAPRWPPTRTMSSLARS